MPTGARHPAAPSDVLPGLERPGYPPAPRTRRCCQASDSHLDSILLSIGVTVGAAAQERWWIRVLAGVCTTVLLTLTVEIGSSAGRGPLARLADWVIDVRRYRSRRGVPPRRPPFIAVQSSSRHNRPRLAQSVSTTGSPGVTTMVCSACADIVPSAVRTVHPSLVGRTAPVPAEMIGSIVSTSPAVSGCERRAT